MSQNKCILCDGTGRITQAMMIGENVTVILVECPRCRGTGKKKE